MNKKFVKEVLKLAPEWSAIDGYFYTKPIDHILWGFVVERPPGVVYFWHFAFPLYDRFERLHLTFGDRLPGTDQYMEMSSGREKAVAAVFVERMRKYKEEKASLATLDGFAADLNNEGLRNPRVRRAYAVTLIMLGRDEEAIEHLQTLVADDYVKKRKGFYDDMALLLSELTEGGGEKARDTLAIWEAETKRHLGLA